MKNYKAFALSALIFIVVLATASCQSTYDHHPVPEYRGPMNDDLTYTELDLCFDDLFPGNEHRTFRKDETESLSIYSEDGGAFDLHHVIYMTRVTDEGEKNLFVYITEELKSYSGDWITVSSGRFDFELDISLFEEGEYTAEIYCNDEKFIYYFTVLSDEETEKYKNAAVTIEAESLTTESEIKVKFESGCEDSINIYNIPYFEKLDPETGIWRFAVYGTQYREDGRITVHDIRINGANKQYTVDLSETPIEAGTYRAAVYTGVGAFRSAEFTITDTE